MEHTIFSKENHKLVNELHEMRDIFVLVQHKPLLLELVINEIQDFTENLDHMKKDLLIYFL